MAADVDNQFDKLERKEKWISSIAQRLVANEEEIKKHEEAVEEIKEDQESQEVVFSSI